MTEVVTDVEEIWENGHIIVAEQGVLHSEADQEITTIPEDPTEDKTAIGIEVMSHSKGLEVNPNHHLEDIEMHQGLLAKIKIDISITDSLVILQRMLWEGHIFKQSASLRRKTN